MSEPVPNKIVIPTRPETLAYAQEQTGVVADPDPNKRDRLDQVVVAIAEMAVMHRMAGSVKSTGPDIALAEIGIALGHRSRV